MQIGRESQKDAVAARDRQALRHRFQSNTAIDAETPAFAEAAVFSRDHRTLPVSYRGIRPPASSASPASSAASISTNTLGDLTLKKPQLSGDEQAD